MKRWFQKGAAASLLLGALVILGSCGGSVPADEPVVPTAPAMTGGSPGAIRGRLGYSYLPSEPAGSRRKDLTSAVTHVGAFPVVTSGLGTSASDQGVSAPLGADGSFELSLDTRSDWILLLIDVNAADRRSKVVGFIAMADGTGSIVRLPMPYAVEGIDLGLLEPVGDEARSGDLAQSGPEVFRLSASQLDELASVDNVFKSIKNAYLNYDPVSGVYYRFIVDFIWLTRISDAPNVFSKVEEAEYGVYNLTADTNDRSYRYEDVATGATALRVFPPTDVDFSQGDTWGPSRPITNANSKIGETWEDGTVYFNALGEPFAGSIRAGGSVLQFGMAGGLGIPPSGYWSFEADGREVALYDGSAANPFDGEGRIRVYVPSVKVSTDDGNRILGIDVKWFLWNPSTESYEEIADSTILSMCMPGYSISMTDFDGIDSNGGQRISEGFGESTPSVTSFQRTWHYFGDSSTIEPVVGVLTIEYIVGDTRYHFDWR